MRNRIINSLTGVVTQDIVGTKDELKYFRVMGSEDRINPQKRYYDNKNDYLVHTLLKRFKGKIEHLEGSLRTHIPSIEAEWENFKKMSDKQSLCKIEEIICDEPKVTFSYIAGEVQGGWKIVGTKGR